MESILLKVIEQVLDSLDIQGEDRELVIKFYNNPSAKDLAGLNAKLTTCKVLYDEPNDFFMVEKADA